MVDDAWWRTAVIYEIAVPSFQDSNGDGWGDIPGLIQRLDYLRDLGVGGIWLTPINRSPMYDLGYDVADYQDVDPRFGSLDDFDRLVAESHDRGLRVIIDFVPNHTSVEHPWFQESSASRDNAKADWYLWSDAGPGGRPPNNWVNRFGTSGWTWNEARQQYYFGSFSPQQPDLDWRHRDVRAAMYDVMRFWLRRGVDGLRIDALAHLIKDKQLRDNPVNLGYNENEEPSNKLALVYHQNQPELLEVIREFRQVFDEFDDRVMLGEVYLSAEQLTAYQSAGAHLLLSTSMLQITFEAAHVRNMVDLLEARTAVGGWPARSSGNHDIGRVANRVGVANARLAAMLHLSVRGTPTIYYGEELGLEKFDVPVDRIQDPSGKDNPKFGRDGYRAPMPWDDSPQGGFSSVEPWLPMDELSLSRHVEAQLEDPGSVLNFYRELLRFRNSQPLLQLGDYAPVDAPPPVFAFTRGDRERGLLVVLNMGDADVTLNLREYWRGPTGAQVLFSTVFRQDNACTDTLVLGPREGLVAQLRELAQ